MLLLIRFYLGCTSAVFAWFLLLSVGSFSTVERGDSVASVLEKIYTVLDTIFNFFEWIYSAIASAGDWLSNSWHTVSSFLAACPASVVALAAAIFAIGLLCLLLNR